VATDDTIVNATVACGGVDIIVSSVATQSTTTHVSGVDTIVSTASIHSPHATVALTIVSSVATQWTEN
jgi:hypothetical protein